MNERIKELRKALGLTLEKFGDRVGVTKQTVSRIENGKNNVTEQMFKSIVREFNVNPEWLESGKGEMLATLSTHDQIEKIVTTALNGEDDFRIQVFTALGEMTDAEWDLVRNFVRKIKLEDEPKSTYDRLPKTPEEFEELYPPVSQKPKEDIG